MGSNFTRGRVLQGVAVVFEGDIWVEDDSAKAGSVPWKAGYFAPTTTPVIAGDCRLELTDGRTGTMTCIKSHPGMSGGSSLQFHGTGPLLGDRQQGHGRVLARACRSATVAHRDGTFPSAAQQENQILTVWIRNRLRESLKEKSGS